MRNQLLDLPDELLLEIFSYIDPNQDNRVTGHIEDEPPLDPPDPYLLKDFYLHNLTLCSIASTCKRLSRLAQEVLFSAPVIGTKSPPSPAECEHLSLFSFVHAVLRRPGLGEHVKQLRVSLLSFEKLDDDGTTKLREIVDTYLKNANGMLGLVKNITTSLHASDVLIDELGLRQNTRLIHILLESLVGLLPRLEKLCLSEHKVDSELLRSRLRQYNLSYTSSKLPANDVYKDLLRAPSAPKLRYLKIESFLPAVLSGLYLFPTLETLDISTNLALLPHLKLVEISDQCANSKTRDDLRKIKHLRADFRVTTMGTWNATARYCILNIIRGFRELTSLDIYAEPSYNKNPYRSVRSFPHYQMNIQNYPDDTTESGTEAQYWDERVYHARTRITEYQTLIDGLVHLKSCLKKLRLPGGFWTLPGGLRKPLPRFDHFTQLETLMVPQAAIICIKLDNMRFQHVEGDFDLSPVAVLPPRLRHLRIFDVDASFLQSSWLHELVTEQRDNTRWPCMRQLEILFGWMSREVDEDVLRTVLRPTLGDLIEEVKFEVVLGMDNEVPSLSFL